MSMLDTLIDTAVKDKPEPNPFKTYNSENFYDTKPISETQSDNSDSLSKSQTQTQSVNSNRLGKIQTGHYIRDPKGNLFDPEIHATDDNGNPKYTKHGMFAKKRGRKSGQTSNGTTKPNPETNKNYQAKVAGRATANTIFAICQGLGGSEWKPIIDDEKGLNEFDAMQDAWAEYFLATGKTDLPPGAVVAVVCATYALPRFAMPQTQSRLSKAWEFFQFKIWKSIKSRREAKAKKQHEKQKTENNKPTFFGVR